MHSRQIMIRGCLALAGLLLLAACRPAPTARAAAFRYLPAPASRDSVVDDLWDAVWNADRIGLDTLARRALPTGYEELRLTRLCSLCARETVIRLVRQPSGEVSGEAILVLSVLAGDSTSEYAAWRRGLPPAVGCVVRGSGNGDPNYEVCRGGRLATGNWAGLWRAASRAGALEPRSLVPLPASPTPSGPLRCEGDRCEISVEGGGCDIACPSIVVEYSAGSVYRGGAAPCPENGALEAGATDARARRVAQLCRLADEVVSRAGVP